MRQHPPRSGFVLRGIPDISEARNPSPPRAKRQYGRHYGQHFPIADLEDQLIKLVAGEDCLYFLTISMRAESPQLESEI